MGEKVFDISLETIWNKLEADALSDEFVVFDNFEDTRDLFEILDVPNYPMRINLNMIIVCTKGYMKIKQGVNEIIVSENEFIVIQTDQIFQFYEISPDLKAGCLLVKDGFLLEQSDIRSLLFDVGKTLTWKSSHTIPHEHIGETQNLFNGIRNSIRQKDNKYRTLIVHHYFRIMFYHVCNVLLSEQEKIVESSSRNEEIFYRFIRDVNDEFYIHRKIQYYASKASLTPKYFSRIIFEISGKRASDWINEYVILEAKILLKNTSLTIQQISDKLNFSNQSHFSRYFSLHTGLSPFAYRTQ